MQSDSSRRILVVDDNQAIHEDFRKILAAPSRAIDAAGAALFGEVPDRRPHLGFELSFASQGQEALAAVQQARREGRPFALAFVDVRMPPGWDGVETAARLWESEPDLQIVICTAYSDYSWGQMVGQLGHSDRLLILKKPFDNIEVLQLATALTEKWRLTQLARVRVGELEARVQERTAKLMAALAQLERSLAERERADAALRASEKKYSTAFRLHPDAITLRRLRDGRCLEVNASFTAITGYQEAEVLGPDAVFEEADLWLDAADYARFAADLCRDGKVVGFEAPLRHKGGATLHGSISARTVELEGERCVLTITRDVTARKQLEAQLVQAQKMEAVGQLAGGVAHDYNNILTATLAHLGLLLEQQQLGTETKLALTELEQMAKRAAALTRQLLTFGRQQLIQMSPLDLNEVLGNLFVMLRRLLGENIELELRRAGVPLRLEADVGMLEQVITNLCVNARDAMLPRGGRLRVEACLVTLDEHAARTNPEARPGSFVRLAVADEGCGMDAATRTRIFEPFFTTKEPGKGTGLGLATVYGITKQHRGWIEVESAPGRGTTFFVFLPAMTAAVTSEAAPAAPAESFGSETILLVEDEPAVRSMVALTLRRCGYRVLEAPDGRAAIQMWTDRATEIDLLFTDMVMPNGLTGLDVAEHFHRANAAMKIVVTSGYSSELNRSGVPAGLGIVFFPKPYEVGELRRMLRQCLDGEAATRDARVELPAAPVIVVN